MAKCFVFDILWRKTLVIGTASAHGAMGHGGHNELFIVPASSPQSV